MDSELNKVNVYCDESCHLENDNQKIMVLGAVWCPKKEKENIFKEICEIKSKYKVSARNELKWTKLSPSKESLYIELVDYFFNSEHLRFRGLVVNGKDKLKHENYVGQDHDTWYYKMYFYLLNFIIAPKTEYDIYLDKKDTKSGEKIEKLKEILRNSNYDFSMDVINKIQVVHSHEIELMQILDILIGALSYYNRLLNTSSAKLNVIEKIKARSGYNLNKTTLMKEDKFNVFIWTPRERF